MILVADIGGTNCRLALGQGGALLPGTLARLKVADFPGIAPALDQYLAAQGAPALTAACLAVAGPVLDGRVRLTNGGWTMAEATLSARLGCSVLLLNDLAALGHALPHLPPGASQPLHLPEGPHPNGQALVLGLGTGANCAAVIRRPGQPPAILSAEAGHLSLPHALAVQLSRHIGPDLAAFPSVETLFAARGLSRLHACLHGAALPPESLTSGAPDPGVRATLDLFADLLGLWLQDLALASLPRDGIWLAGSVAQGLVQAGHGAALVRSFARPNENGGPIAAIPLHLITDDLAALTGCLAAAP